MFSYVIAMLGAVHLHTVTYIYQGAAELRLKRLIYQGAAKLRLKEFEELYNKAMEEQFGSLIIDCSHKYKQFLRWLHTESIIK